MTAKYQAGFKQRGGAPGSWSAKPQGERVLFGGVSHGSVTLGKTTVYANPDGIGAKADIFTFTAVDEEFSIAGVAGRGTLQFKQGASAQIGRGNVKLGFNLLSAKGCGSLGGFGVCVEAGAKIEYARGKTDDTWTQSIGPVTVDIHINNPIVHRVIDFLPSPGLPHSFPMRRALDLLGDRFLVEFPIMDFGRGPEYQ